MWGKAIFQLSSGRWKPAPYLWADLILSFMTELTAQSGSGSRVFVMLTSTKETEPFIIAIIMTGSTLYHFWRVFFHAQRWMELTCSSDCCTWAAADATWSSRKARSVSVVVLLILRAHCSKSPSAPSRPYTAPAARYTYTEKKPQTNPIQTDSIAHEDVELVLTFSSILVSLWSSLRVSELQEVGEVRDSDGE